MERARHLIKCYGLSGLLIPFHPHFMNGILLFWYYFPQCMWTLGVVRKQHHVIVFLWLKIYLFIFHWWSKPYYTLIKQHVVRKDQLNIKHFCFLVFLLKWLVGWLIDWLTDWLDVVSCPLLIRSGHRCWFSPICSVALDVQKGAIIVPHLLWHKTYFFLSPPKECSSYSMRGWHKLISLNGRVIQTHLTL